MNIWKVTVNYLKNRGRYYIFCALMAASFNLYYIFLMRDRHAEYLLYLDFLLLAAALLFAGVDFYRYAWLEAEKNRFMQQGEVVSQWLPAFENKDIAEHDVRVLSDRLKERFDENCDLQDYVAKWCHELKVPLAASLLMDEKIEDAELKIALREQLEKMNQQLSAMLLGCKLQSALFDIQVKQASLKECVRTSIRNNQFFLIQKGFEMDIRTEELFVYTDPSWLIYILDQLLNNAIKYAGDAPRLRIWTKKSGQSAELFVEDCGEGILDSDLRRIFEKGFTGSNYHNGKYKSTGMGLYMVSKIIARLGHEISVESVYGEYTRFCIVMLQAVL